jgi:secernin
VGTHVRERLEVLTMCDTLVLVRPGSVLFAKNSDRDPNEAQLLEWHPARDHAPGSDVACTYVRIPQVRRTHAVLLSRPFWMWGAEMGANDQGVVIGNEAVFTREPYADTGLLGMDLLRLALERAATAERAVEVLTDLLDTYGQGGGCGHEDRSFTYHNSFLVADHRSAYVLETAGRRWEVEHVTDGARAISNGLTIPGFAERYADRLRTRVSACRARRAITEPGAAAATSALDLAGVLRDHGTADGTPRYSALNGAMAAPCMHAGGLATASQTTASWVSELTPDGARHWATGTSAPCTGLFKPVDVQTPVDLGPAPIDVADDRSAWWRHERLHRLVVRDPAALLPRYAAERDELERTWFTAPPTSAEAFAEADRVTATWLARVSDEGAVADTRPAYVRRYWRVRDRHAGLDPAASLAAG